MTASTRTFTVADDIDLMAWSWFPDALPRATVVLAHGLHEHAGRYRALGERMQAEGFGLHAIDLRGHGRSGGTRANVRSFDDLVDDLLAFDREVHAGAPEVPRFLFGHSMGGVVALRAVLRRPDGWAGLLVESPYLRNARPLPTWLGPLARPLSRWLPELPTLRLSPSLMSRDPAEVQAYATDPLVYQGAVKLGIGLGLTLAAEEVLTRAAELTLPLRIAHGTDDRVADPAASRELFERAGSPDKELALYPGGYHELLNDLDRERVMDEMVDWISRHLPPSAGSRAEARPS